jgi:hypothetical protein
LLGFSSLAFLLFSLLRFAFFVLVFFVAGTQLAVRLAGKGKRVVARQTRRLIGRKAAA